MAAWKRAQGDGGGRREKSCLEFVTPRGVRWSIRNHLLSGITIQQWMCLMWTYAREIAWLGYAHRLVFLSVMSVMNSGAAVVERIVFGRDIARMRVPSRPLIILGHPRTGTTHLHNLLSRDDARFAFASTLDVGFPSSCVLMGAGGEPLRALLSPLLDETRPMDAMRLDWTLPQEDELAVNQLTGGTVSPYMAVCFPSAAERLEPFYALQQSDGCSIQQKRTWIRAFMHFMQKVVLRWHHTHPHAHESPRLLLKSPVHTARIPLLLEMFPDAQFVYIHRNPLDVMRSAVHMANTYYHFSALQTPRDDALETFIVDQFTLLTRRYLRDRSMIAKEHLVEISFDELEADPVATLRRIYVDLQLGDNFDEDMVPKVKAYIDENNLGNFKKNQYAPLNREASQLIRQSCPEAFNAFGYS